MWPVRYLDSRRRRGGDGCVVDGQEQRVVGSGLGGGLFVELGERRVEAAAPGGGEGLQVGRFRDSAAGRRGDAAVYAHSVAESETLGTELLPGVRGGDHVNDDGGGARSAQFEFAYQPVPGQSGVAQGGRCGPGECEVEQALLAVEVELSGDVEGERAGCSGCGADAGEDGLRVGRVGEFNDGGRRRAGQDAGRDRRERGQDAGCVDETVLAGRGCRDQQRGPGCRVLPVDHHNSTVAAARLVNVTSGRLACPRPSRSAGVLSHRMQGAGQSSRQVACRRVRNLMICGSSPVQGARASSTGE